MTLYLWSFFAGLLALPFLPEIPSWWLFILLACLAWVLPWRVQRILLIFLLGLVIAALQAELRLQQLTQPFYEGLWLEVNGTISQPVKRVNDRAYRVDFRVDELRLPGGQLLAPAPKQLRLNWYKAKKPLKIGQRWRLQIKLKRVLNFANPGGFDYELHLLRSGIDGKGYVKKSLAYLGESEDWLIQWRAYRTTLHQRFNAAFSDLSLAPVLLALSLGERSQMSETHWQVFRDTGTAHLMAISGLHIGAVAGIGFLLVSVIWRRIPSLCLRWPAVYPASIAAWVFGLSYGMLSGMALPTQRAVLMLSVALFMLLARVHWKAEHFLAISALLIALVQPFALLSAGFWLSFAAVAILLLSVYWTQGIQLGLLRLLVVQLILLLLMAPLGLLFFQQISLAGLVANLLAVPLVSFVILPLTGLGLVGLMFWPPLAAVLYPLANMPMEALWQALQYLAALPWAVVSWQAEPWVLGLLALALMLVSLGYRLGLNWLVLLLCVPLFIHQPYRPPQGELRLVMLDVGQGLSVFIQTHAHQLLFDAGAKYGSFDTGERVVVPFLQHNGIRQLDRLIISHADNDHIGGAKTIIDALPVRSLYTSAPQAFPPLSAQACTAGQHWHWDGVTFEIIHPRQLVKKRNNNSCVLKVTAGENSVLLTADIEAAAERQMLNASPAKLASAVMLIPHHASTSSSLPAFIAAVNPQLALVNYGYGNRYSFPKAEILQRYWQLDVSLLSNVEFGAITLDISPQSIQIAPNYRQQHKRYWQMLPDSLRP